MILDNKKSYSYGKKIMFMLLDSMSAEKFFTFGTLMVILSIIGLFIILPFVNEIISQLDNSIESKNRNIDNLDDKIQLSYYNIGIGYNYLNTLVILDELNVSQKRKADMELLLKEFMYRAIISKLNDTESNSFNKKEIMSLEIKEIRNINDIADRNIRLRYNKYLDEENHLVQEKNNWLSLEKAMQIILGSTNTIGLLFISFAEWKRSNKNKRCEI